MAILVRVGNQDISASIEPGGSERSQQPGTVESVGNVHWTVARSANGLFVGREQE